MNDKSQAAKAVAEVQGIVGKIRGSSKSTTKQSISEIVQRLESVGGLNILNEVVAENNKHIQKPQQPAAAPTHLSNIAKDVIDEASTRVAQDTYYNPNSATSRMIESRPSATSQMRPVTTGLWKVNPVETRTKSGKMKVRFQVSSTRAIVPDMWRHKIVAEMVASALEQTNGNLSDPRIEKIRDLSRREEELLTEIKNQKRLVESVTPENVKRRGAHEAKLEEAKRALTIVRRNLGVA